MIKSEQPVSIRELTALFGVVYQTARTYLLALTGKGYLELGRDRKK